MKKYIISVSFALILLLSYQTTQASFFGDLFHRIFGGKTSVVEKSNLGASANVPAPTISLKADKTSLSSAGGTATITWSTTGTPSCTASGGWIGGKYYGGTQAVSVTKTTDYTLTCKNAGGTTSATVTVTVATPPTPVATPSIRMSGSSGSQVSDSSISVNVGDTFTVSGMPQNLQGLSFSRAFFVNQNFSNNNSCGNNEASANGVWTMTCTAKILGSSDIYVEIYANGQTYRSNKVTVTINSTPSSSIKVLSPNGGETYVAGQQITVKWKSSNIPASAVILIDSDWVQALGPNFHTSSVNDGSESFVMPSNYVGQFKFIVSAKDKDTYSASDSSDNLFTINAPTASIPSITYFTPTNSIKTGTTITILGNNFSSNSKVDLRGPAYDSLIPTSFLSSTQMTFVIPNDVNNGTYNYDLSVTNGENLTSSNVSITITGDNIIALTPSITVLSPQSGSTFKAGQNIDVSWNTNASKDTFVYVAIADSSGYYIKEVRTPNDGKETIKIPSNTPAGEYKVYYQVVYSSDASGYHMTNPLTFYVTSETTPIATCTLNTPTLVSSSSTASQYVAISNGIATDATKATFNFTSKGCDVTIDSLKFSGSNMTSIKLNDLSSIFNKYGKATFTNLNLKVPNNDSGINVDVYASYPNVGVAGISSGSTSQLTLISVKYVDNNISTTTTITPSISAPKIMIVGSKPFIAKSPQSPSGRSILNGLVRVIVLTVSANSTGDIKINSLPIKFSTIGVKLNTSLSNTIVVRDDSDSIVKTTNLPISTDGNSIINFTGGYNISANTSKTFNILIPVTSSGNPGSGASIVTSLGDISKLSWSDSTGKILKGNNNKIYFSNYPTISSILYN
jgi:hypothetical protein